MTVSSNQELVCCFSLEKFHHNHEYKESWLLVIKNILESQNVTSINFVVEDGPWPMSNDWRLPVSFDKIKEAVDLVCDVFDEYYEPLPACKLKNL